MVTIHSVTLGYRVGMIIPLIYIIPSTASMNCHCNMKIHIDALAFALSFE